MRPPFFIEIISDVHTLSEWTTKRAMEDALGLPRRPDKLPSSPIDFAAVLLKSLDTTENISEVTLNLPYLGHTYVMAQPPDADDIFPVWEKIETTPKGTKWGLIRQDIELGMWGEDEAYSACQCQERDIVVARINRSRMIEETGQWYEKIYEPGIVGKTRDDTIAVYSGNLLTGTTRRVLRKQTCAQPISSFEISLRNNRRWCLGEEE